MMCGLAWSAVPHFPVIVVLKLTLYWSKRMISFKVLHKLLIFEIACYATGASARKMGTNFRCSKWSCNSKVDTYIGSRKYFTCPVLIPQTREIRWQILLLVVLVIMQIVYLISAHWLWYFCILLLSSFPSQQIFVFSLFSLFYGKGDGKVYLCW